MPPEDIDARILQALEADPWSSVRTIAEFLKIPALTGHLRLTLLSTSKADISNGFLIFLMVI
jgi:DNA-binding Lrp family transcriptional regulator